MPSSPATRWHVSLAHRGAWLGGERTDRRRWRHDLPARLCELGCEGMSPSASAPVTGEDEAIDRTQTGGPVKGRRGTRHQVKRH
jgi:hypothetical protein